MSTASKVRRFLARCERDPHQVLEQVRTELARGENPVALAEQWNIEPVPLLIAAKVDRSKAIAIVVDRAIFAFLDRDGIITTDTSRFIRRLNDRARLLKSSTRRVLADMDRRIKAMLDEPTAWPIKAERKAINQIRQLDQKASKKRSRDQEYRNTGNTEFRPAKPAENCASKIALVEETPFIEKPDSLKEDDLLAIPGFLDRRTGKTRR